MFDQFVLGNVTQGPQAQEAEIVSDFAGQSGLVQGL
jgi:hypothetical protein